MSDETGASAVMEVSDSASNPATKTTTAAKKATLKKSDVSKKSGVTATGSSHPRYSDMVVATIRSLSSRTGVSRQAIIKKMKEDYDLGDNETKIANWVRITLKKGLESGLLKKAAVEGRKGAGSYKLGDQAKSSVWDKSKAKSSAKSISAGSPASNVKKPKTKKVTTPVKTGKSKTAAKSSNSKVVKKTETYKAGKTKLKKTAEAATKKQTAAAKKPATAAKKSAAATKKPGVTNKKTTTAAKKTGSTATGAKGVGAKKSGKK